MDLLDAVWLIPTLPLAGFLVLVVAAAEVVVGLGIIVSIFRRRAGEGTTADDLHLLKG
jgi:NADH-quinone oxidoreductase subunit K